MLLNSRRLFERKKKSLGVAASVLSAVFRLAAVSNKELFTSDTLRALTYYWAGGSNVFLIPKD